MSLDKEAILGAQDLKMERVEVPEWGGEVCVRCMTGAERDEFENEAWDVRGDDVKVNRENFRARLLVRTITDEGGKRLFSNQDLAALGAKSARALDRLFAAATRLNGLSREDVKALTKN